MNPHRSQAIAPARSGFFSRLIHTVVSQFTDPAKRTDNGSILLHTSLFAATVVILKKF
ncbi:hypothetical protein IWQ62_003362, partial [Dispira parvispora]